jgi:hypothetical protein
MKTMVALIQRALVGATSMPEKVKANQDQHCYERVSAKVEVLFGIS